MPSNSYSNFNNNLMKDVIRLYQSHGQLNHTGRGKRGLGHITRSGVFMLCAAWEMYNEDLIKECARIILQYIENPNNLPKTIRKNIVDNISERKDKSIVLSMAGNGWKQVFLNICDIELNGLNTPKSEKLNTLYEKYLGISKIYNNWSVGKVYIDDFVIARGDIAHKGSSATYIKFPVFKQYITDITRTVEENDKYVLNYLKSTFTGGRSPWNNVYNTIQLP